MFDFALYKCSHYITVRYKLISDELLNLHLKTTSRLKLRLMYLTVKSAKQKLLTTIAIDFG